jgi:hypothetical protein
LKDVDGERMRIKTHQTITGTLFYFYTVEKYIRKGIHRNSNTNVTNDSIEL